MYLLFYCQLLSRLSCHSVQRMFLKMNTSIKHINQSKSTTTCAQYSKRNGQERDKTAYACQISKRQLNRRRDMAIFRFFKMAAAAILDFSNFKFLTVGRLKRAELRRHAKLGRNRSKRGRDIAIF